MESLTAKDVVAGLLLETAGAPGLLVVQATHLSSVDLLFTIQTGQSHDPSTGLNF